MCPLSMCRMTYVPFTVDYAHVPHCLCAPLPCPYVNLEGGHVTLPLCLWLMGQQYVKRCQVVKKM